jgi:hypothetical protein
VYNWRDIMERALWTAIEAGLGALPPGFTLAAAIGSWKVILLSAATAGIGFLIAVVKNMAKQKLEAAA